MTFRPFSNASEGSGLYVIEAYEAGRPPMFWSPEFTELRKRYSPERN